MLISLFVIHIFDSKIHIVKSTSIFKPNDKLDPCAYLIYRDYLNAYEREHK